MATDPFARLGVSRRQFVKATAALAAASMAPTARAATPKVHARGSDEIRVGLIGCGGRGTGAVHNALEADAGVKIVALADVFSDRLSSCREHLATLGERAAVSPERCHAGFDGRQRLLAEDLDVVILATPPHFRPEHLGAAIAAGKHVFCEKPVAVDAPGIRRVLAAADEADRRKLCIVAGTQRRHENSYLEAMSRIRDGALGEVVAARCYWNMGGLWMNARQPGWSDMEWQLRNWLYFTWLSGDHIVEQHVHNLDVCNWAIGSHPARALGMGGRQVRVDPAYGHIFDHFAVEYEYPGGACVTSMCRQTDGCASRVEEAFRGTKGSMLTRPGYAAINGGPGWAYAGAPQNPYLQEHVDLMGALRSGTHLNEARQVAEATLTAIMGRMSAYTGQEVTWEQALNSQEDLSPAQYAFGPMPVPPVAVPGKTPLV